MAKKVVKKKKLKIIPFLIVLLVIGGLSFGLYKTMTAKIKNIIISNADYLKDDYIIDLAGIRDYPSFYLTNSLKMKKKLLKSPYIREVKIKREFYHILEIDVTVNRPLFINKDSGMVVFEDKRTILETEANIVFRVPRLINYVPDDKYDTFIEKMAKVDKGTLGKISDIEYVPNDYDKDRFLLYMDDGNMVYLTLTKFKQIEYYNDVLEQLEGRKGILYLDSGNHFQIKE
ncbi:MAG: FtsQ-type POTRA domain-containing protein [Tenericutes bacterium]|nr:FtsQ-type POTRA domain-containing protein [Mycoplasmatota bacterium]